MHVWRSFQRRFLTAVAVGTLAATPSWTLPVNASNPDSLAMSAGLPGLGLSRIAFFRPSLPEIPAPASGRPVTGEPGPHSPEDGHPGAEPVEETVLHGSISGKELKCLTTAVYFEARGEPRRGQAAVAKVILNRVESKAYPDTICGVVYQNASRRNRCQFSFACDGRPDTARERPAWRRAEAVAADVVHGHGVSGAVLTATHYHADYVRPRWASKLKRLSVIGRHVFYRG